MWCLLRCCESFIVYCSTSVGWVRAWGQWVVMVEIEREKKERTLRAWAECAHGGSGDVDQRRSAVIGCWTAGADSWGVLGRWHCLQQFVGAGVGSGAGTLAPPTTRRWACPAGIICCICALVGLLLWGICFVLIGRRVGLFGSMLLLVGTVHRFVLFITVYFPPLSSTHAVTRLASESHRRVTIEWVVEVRW